VALGRHEQLFGNVDTDPQKRMREK
jgi:hypothetical protein